MMYYDQLKSSKRGCQYAVRMKMLARVLEGIIHFSEVKMSAKAISS